jgi:hypothetical protein
MLEIFLIVVVLALFVHCASWLYWYQLKPRFPRMNPAAYIISWLIFFAMLMHSPIGQWSTDKILCSSSETLLSDVIANKSDRDIKDPCATYFEACFRDGEGTPRADIAGLCGRS